MDTLEGSWQKHFMRYLVSEDGVPNVLTLKNSEIYGKLSTWKEKHYDNVNHFKSSVESFVKVAMSWNKCNNMNMTCKGKVWDPIKKDSVRYCEFNVVLLRQFLQDDLSATASLKQTRDAEPQAKKQRLAHSEKNLYCVQWVNVNPKGVEPTPVMLFKIGSGFHPREETVHGQNPVKFPVIFVWQGMAHLETRIHKHLDAHRYKGDGGREWFDLAFCGGLDQVVAYVDRYVNYEEGKQ